MNRMMNNISWLGQVAGEGGAASPDTKQVSAEANSLNCGRVRTRLPGKDLAYFHQISDSFYRVLNGV